MSEEIIKRLFIGGITDDCTEKDLNGRFERFGKILTVDIPQDSISGNFFFFFFFSLYIYILKANIEIYIHYHCYFHYLIVNR